MKKEIKELSKVKRKVFPLFIILLVCVIASGCDKTNTSTNGTFSEYPKGEVSYPIASDDEISFWVWLNPNVAKTSLSLNETDFARQLIKETGIKVKYIQPAVGQEEEKFNLLFSSGDIPDIVCSISWNNFPGGADGAISNGYIMSLNDDVQDYAPNYSKLLKENPDIDKAAKSEAGYYYSFGSIGNGVLASGPLIRGDWLEELNLSVPETIDEWYMTLKAFKEKKGASAPLSVSNVSSLYDVFMSAYDVVLSALNAQPKFTVEDGKVKYGPLQPGYKDFVREMHKWYVEGLIDKNIALSDTTALNAKILNDQTGASAGWVASSIGAWMNAKVGTDDEFSIVATPYPVLTKGKTPKMMASDVRFAPFASISAQSKNKEAAMRFLDYGYSEAGHMLHNFGQEGITYNITGGKPVFTDMILKNPDKLSVAEALGKYSHGSWGGSYVASVDGYLQQLTYPQQRDAVEVWAETDRSYAMPPVVVSAKDSMEFSSIMTEIETYVKEKTLGMICDLVPLDTLDKMEVQLKNMDIDRAIEIKQATLDKYNEVK